LGALLRETIRFVLRVPTNLLAAVVIVNAVGFRVSIESKESSFGELDYTFYEGSTAWDCAIRVFSLSRFLFAYFELCA